ncbi:MAG: hypothetical protein QM759_10550 [Terricaulis sp.]
MARNSNAAFSGLRRELAIIAARDRAYHARLQAELKWAADIADVQFCPNGEETAAKSVAMQLVTARMNERDSHGVYQTSDMSLWGANGPIADRAREATTERDAAYANIDEGVHSGNWLEVGLGGLQTVGAVFDYLSSPATGTLEELGMDLGHSQQQARSDANFVFNGALLAASLPAMGGKAFVEAGQYAAEADMGLAAETTLNPLNPVLEFGPKGEEIVYRTMSEAHFEYLQQTGTLLPTTETSTSPLLSYASKYDGITVRLTTAPGTSASLQEIGIAANEPAAEQFPGMSTRTGPWMQTNTRFKVESGQMTTQLGQGRGIDIFNANLLGFERVPK